VRVGVTGSVGKTSVKEALAAVFRKAGAGALEREELQQSLGRAADPVAHARRHPARRV
jgi:UDP-N-acetylmuramyl pentapeptide synthase